LHRGVAGLSIKRFGREPNFKSVIWNTEEMEDNIKVVFTEFVRMDTDLIQQPDLELVALNFGKRLWE
jgi:hypothetical protein